MAGKMARGLGKGLDSLIPDAVGEAKVKKEAVETKAIDDAVEKILMRIPYRNYLTLSSR